MSNEVMNAHCEYGLPCGYNAGCCEVAEWAGHLLMEQRVTIAAKDAEIKRAKKWIAQQCEEFTGDHACAQCFPTSGLLEDGFVCVYHWATTESEATDGD
jgi:hypothetical protein